MRTKMGLSMEESFARQCTLTVPRVEMSTTTRSQGGCTMQKRPTKLLRGDQCVVRSEEDEN